MSVRASCIAAINKVTEQRSDIYLIGVNEPIGIQASPAAETEWMEWCEPLDDD